MFASTSRHRCFTLLELVAVLAILGVLIALLLPAVQSARETARRSQCLSHLRQIGLAIAQYHETDQCFPPAAITAPEAVAARRFERDDGFGWQVMILPYLDRTPLYETIAPDGRFGVFRRHYLATGTTYPGCETVVPVYRCPSSALPSHAADFGPEPLPAYRRGYAVTDYQGSRGGGPTGVIVESGSAAGKMVRLSSITDGASQTLLVGESSYPGKRGQNTPTWAGYVGTPAVGVFVTMQGRTIDCGMKHRGHRFWLDARYDMCATSYHPGGAQFLFADGHARFISKSIDADTYKYLGGRADGRIVTDF